MDVGDDIVKQGRTPAILPFDMSGIGRTDDGVLRYTGLARSLLDMFRASVDRDPDRECIVILGGERVSYRDVWDRSARVAGGLVAAGVERATGSPTGTATRSSGASGSGAR